jgi:hypothetical protein
MVQHTLYSVRIRSSIYYSDAYKQKVEVIQNHDNWKVKDFSGQS